MCKKIFFAVLCLFFSITLHATEMKVISDAAGRQIHVPEKVNRVVCSGPGCLRLLTYLKAQDKVVAVDSIEKRRTIFDARPYALANLQFRNYPLFGEFRGFDQPELILALEKQPQVILKTFANYGYDPQELQNKIGIPVVVLNYGDLGLHRNDLFQALRVMGKIVGKEQRAEEVIAFFNKSIDDLSRRTLNVPDDECRSCFVGGIAFRGPHGLQSTEPSYPPFVFIHAANVVGRSSNKGLLHCNVSKEQIVAWDPEVIFLDLSTIQMGAKAGALFELKTDPAFRILSAVEHGNVYGVLPYNWYSLNFGSILADAYFIGKQLYPKRFEDVDPRVKADEIYTFLLGRPVFQEMNSAFGNLVFKRIGMD